MYTAEELQNLQMKPRINDITIKVLADYYAFYLNPFIYNYTLKNNPEKSFELWFNKENFCHLLGLETIAKNSVPYKELHKYKGVDGWHNIYGEKEDGFVLDIPHLKTLNKKKFNSIKAKFVYFYLLPSLVSCPLCVIFKNDKVLPPTKIDCDILFYSKVKNDNAIIHLGIKKDTYLGYFIPKTFFIEKVSSKQGDIYLAKQEEIEITVLDRTIML